MIRRSPNPLRTWPRLSLARGKAETRRVFSRLTSTFQVVPGSDSVTGRTLSPGLEKGEDRLTGQADRLPRGGVGHVGVLRGGDDQLTAQLVLELDEGGAICPRGAGGDGDLAGENLDERIRHGLMGAGVADVDL